MTSNADEKRSAAYTRASVRNKVEETLGSASISYSPDGEHYFELPHPMLYDKATKAALKPLADDDDEGIARVLLGEQYDAFIEAGGDPDEIGLLQIAVSQDTRASLTAGRPTKR
ncbi:hypothetical protein [Curtobacterium sp. MCBD17_028]|uniref:hypothetical protein n=1 Tax=Curtobacterium sp. MCBD17_028 TaxID=2175670 RepID=UPI000DA93CE9|nr:hypothetical protein [Curtobacterium sp. MCBD17_028]PZE23855.1 hypothetical protein DEI86_13500 [Curtobacterium sp. MCBD17_028]